MPRYLYQIALYLSFCAPFLLVYLLKRVYKTRCNQVAANACKNVFYLFYFLSVVISAGLFHISITAIETEIHYSFGSMFFTRQGHIRENGMVVGDYYDERLQNSLDKNYFAIHKEIFFRLLNPYDQAWHCAAGDPEICNLTDEVFPPYAVTRSPGSGLLRLAFVLTLGYVSTGGFFQKDWGANS